MTPPSGLNLKNIYFAFIHLAVMVLAVEVFVLARQNREMKAIMTPPEAVKVGSQFVLGPLEALTAGASIDTMAPMLLYVFSTQCGVCRKNIPAWTAIAGAVHSRGLQVAAVSVDSTASTSRYVAENNLRYPVFGTRDGQAFSRRNKIDFVPQTILRDATGLVERVWAGFLTDSVESVVANARPVEGKLNL